MQIFSLFGGNVAVFLPSKLKSGATSEPKGRDFRLESNLLTNTSDERFP
jgi:hypothetical protein